MTLTVEVVYATPQVQTIVEVRLEQGATVEDALSESGIRTQHPEIDTDACRVGIWGRVAARSQILRDRDRVEIYRPLLADPKQIRRRRAEGERKPRR